MCKSFSQAVPNGRGAACIRTDMHRLFVGSMKVYFTSKQGWIKGASCPNAILYFGVQCSTLSAILRNAFRNKRSHRCIWLFRDAVKFKARIRHKVRVWYGLQDTILYFDYIFTLCSDEACNSWYYTG